jgi:hypothetical protein
MAFVSIPMSRMRKRSDLFHSFLDSDWIILILQYDHTISTLLDSDLALSTDPSPSELDISSFLSRSSHQSTISMFPLSLAYSTNGNENQSLMNVFYNLMSFLKNNRGLGQYLAPKRKEKLINPLKCIECGANSPDFEVCSEDCRLKNENCEGAKLSQDIKRNPLVADLLISLLYAAASSGDLKHNLDVLALFL